MTNIENRGRERWITSCCQKVISLMKVHHKLCCATCENLSQVMVPIWSQLMVSYQKLWQVKTSSVALRWCFPEHQFLNFCIFFVLLFLKKFMLCSKTVNGKNHENRLQRKETQRWKKARKNKNGTTREKKGKQFLKKRKKETQTKTRHKERKKRKRKKEKDTFNEKTQKLKKVETDQKLKKFNEFWKIKKQKKLLKVMFGKTSPQGHPTYHNSSQLVTICHELWHVIDDNL